jgi:hypothetical protein
MEKKIELLDPTFVPLRKDSSNLGTPLVKPLK